MSIRGYDFNLCGRHPPTRLLWRGKRPPLHQFLNQALRLLRGHAEIAKRERSFARVQHWFQSFQAFQVGPAPKQSNWNFFAPLITALDRLVQIARVVALFLENFDPGKRSARRQVAGLNPASRTRPALCTTSGSAEDRFQWKARIEMLGRQPFTIEKRGLILMP